MDSEKQFPRRVPALPTSQMANCPPYQVPRPCVMSPCRALLTPEEESIAQGFWKDFAHQEPEQSNRVAHACQTSLGGGSGCRKKSSRSLWLPSKFQANPEYLRPCLRTTAMRAGELAPRLSPGCSSRGAGCDPCLASTWQLTTLCNRSFRGSNALFWSPWHQACMW